MADLAGAKIVLLEARMNSELANLVRRHGGEPVSVPAVREVTKDNSAEVTALIDSLSSNQIDFIVFQTGVGVMTLLNEAEALNRKDELSEALRRTTIIARGPGNPGLLPALIKAQVHALDPNLPANEMNTVAELVRLQLTTQRQLWARRLQL